MMFYSEFSTKLRIFVLKAIEAVWAGGKNRTDVITLESVNILLANGLKKIFVPHTAGGIATAGLFNPQNPKPYAADLRICAKARAMRIFRSSRAALQPTQKRRSASGVSDRKGISSPLHQSVRVADVP
jgi:hypothetical protein